MSLQVALGSVRYEPTNDEVLQRALRELELTGGSVLYEPGCGDARFLVAAQKLVPGVHGVGIERHPSVYLLSRIKVWLSGVQRVEIRFENFMRTDYSKATHVYTFLQPGVMDELLPKFQQELKNARLVSYMHKFSNKEASKEIPVRGNRRDTTRTLYVYDF